MVLLQGSTVPLAQTATHICMHPALWDDNTPRCDSALRDSIIKIFRAVCAADLPSPKFSKSFLFVRLIPRPSIRTFSSSDLPSIRTDECGEVMSANSAGTRLSATAEAFDVEGFERRAGLPVSRAKCRTVFCLRQDGERRRINENADTSDKESPGVWLQLIQHLPTVSCS